MTSSNKRAMTVLGLVLTVAAANTLAYTGQQFAAKAAIGIEQARATALTAQPGKITDEELEKEGGGMRYSFDIRHGKITQEVGVDAMTGKVLENAPEGPNAD